MATRILGKKYMNDINNYKPCLYNDISINDEELYKQHANLINNKKYKEAATLLSSQSEVRGVTASLLNLWEQKIYEIDNTPINYIDPYIFKEDEPTDEEIKDKAIWSQEY